MAETRLFSGQKLREAREAKKWGQKYLGELIEVSQQLVSIWERGMNEPSRKELDQLATVLECSPDQFLVLAGSIPYTPTAAELLGELAKRLGVEDRRPTDPAPGRPFNAQIKIPRVTGFAHGGATGVPVEEVSDDDLEPAYGSPDWAGRALRVMRVSGDSMSPKIDDGDDIVIELGIEPRNGNVVVVLHEAETIVKYWFDGVLTSETGDPIIPNENSKLVGVVLAIQRQLRK